MVASSGICSHHVPAGFAHAAPEPTAASCVAAALVTALLLCVSGVAAEEATGKRTAPGGMQSKEFLEAEQDVMNPERGFTDWINLIVERDYSRVRRKGLTVVYAGVRLDDFRTRPLTGAFLDALRAGFAQVRKAGIKVMLRFTYCDDGPDAPRERILEHIKQLASIVRANADVIAVMHAGFIGKSGYALDATNPNR